MEEDNPQICKKVWNKGRKMLEEKLERGVKGSEDGLRVD